MSRNDIYGRRPQIIRDAVTAAGAKGITPEELAAIAETNVRSLVVVLSRLRTSAGVQTVSVRSSHNGEARYYMAEHDPRIAGLKVRPASARAAREWAEVVKAAGPDGVCCDKLAANATRFQREPIFKAMRHEGWAFFSTYSPVHGRRAFATAEWAEAYRVKLYGGKKINRTAYVRPEPVKVPKAPAAKPTPVVVKSEKPWTPPQKKTLPTPIIPQTVKVQQCPAPMFFNRYKVDPAERIVGGFASLGPGRYLEDAGFTPMAKQRQAGNDEVLKGAA